MFFIIQRCVDGKLIHDLFMTWGSATVVINRNYSIFCCRLPR